MADKKKNAKFNIFTSSDEFTLKTQRSDIRVGYIDKKRGYIKNVSIEEAKRVAKKDPGKMFILETRDRVKYLNINQVIRIRTSDVTPKKSAGSSECSPVEGLKEFEDFRDTEKTFYKTPSDTWYIDIFSTLVDSINHFVSKSIFKILNEN